MGKLYVTAGGRVDAANCIYDESGVIDLDHVVGYCCSPGWSRPFVDNPASRV